MVMSVFSSSALKTIMATHLSGHLLFLFYARIGIELKGRHAGLPGLFDEFALSFLGRDGAALGAGYFENTLLLGLIAGRHPGHSVDHGGGSVRFCFRIGSMRT
jgi:hypothetical protein